MRLLSMLSQEIVITLCSSAVRPLPLFHQNLCQVWCSLRARIRCRTYSLYGEREVKVVIGISTRQTGCSAHCNGINKNGHIDGTTTWTTQRKRESEEYFKCLEPRVFLYRLFTFCTFVLIWSVLLCFDLDWVEGPFRLHALSFVCCAPFALFIL